VRFSDDAERFVTFRVKPDFKRLGARLGKDMKACAALLQAAPGSEVRRGVLGGGYVLALPSGPITLGAEDVVVEVFPREHFQAAGSASAVVALHADIDEDLRQEGLARELINRVQVRRKELQLGYTDRIALNVGADPPLARALERFRGMITRETLAVSLELGALGPEVQNLDGHAFTLELHRIGG
jgi:isoleucyl-tRNA synthetase